MEPSGSVVQAPVAMVLPEPKLGRFPLGTVEDYKAIPVLYIFPPVTP